MSTFRKKSRLKVPDRVAALAAILLLVSSLTSPQDLKSAAENAAHPDHQAITIAVLDTDSTDTNIISQPVRKSRSFNISSLIFRF